MVKDRFQGGAHTDAKISALSAYLRAYSTALKNQRFKLVYIDAFAGSGSYSKGSDEAELTERMLDDCGRVSMPGSARIALETEPAFDLVVFIENKVDAAAELRNILQQYPDRKSLMFEGDANAHLLKLCSETRWKRRTSDCAGIRSVLFLDPFAISVDWDTLLQIGKTEAIDVWYLLNVNAIGRLLQTDISTMPDHNRAHLDRVLGPGWWQEQFYKQAPAQTDLFGDAHSPIVRNADPATIERAFIERLKLHFGYVHPRGLPLRNRGIHWFSLLFMMASRREAAHDLGRKFARSIIDAPQGIIPPRRGERRTAQPGTL